MERRSTARGGSRRPSALWKKAIEAAALPGGPRPASRSGGDPQGFAFLALAHHRLGHRAEARRWLDKLAAYRPKETGDLSWDDVEVRILRREAESLILGGPPAAPSPAAPAPTKEAAGPPGAKPE